MLQRIKKISWNFPQKGVALLLFVIIGLGLLLPIVQIDAWWGTERDPFGPTWGGSFGTGTEASKGFDILGGAAKSIANGIVYVLFGSIASLTSFFLSFSYGTLQWVISPDFISVPFTNNPIVNLGWTTVRDFTNMLFILVLVVIALGSALRLKEYEVKKLLPVLIGIALLINFTPVICGFIIDASNIVMNTFLQGGITSTGFLETASGQIDKIKAIEEPAERLAIGIAFSAFNVIGGIIFLLFAFLFAVRYLALWILVIFSPIAFFCYILPQTKAVWSGWWKQFIQWCIIGIPAAFFIYLTNLMIKNMSDTGGLIRRPAREMAELPSGASGFADLVMYVIPLVFLVIGFFVSLQTSAIGADKVIGFAKTGGTKAGAWAGKKVGETRTAKEVKERTKRGLEKISEQARIPKVWKREKARVEAAATHRAEREKVIEKEQAKIKHMSTEDREIYAKTPIEKVAKFRANTEQGHLSDKDLSEKNLKLMKVYGTPKDLSDAASKRPDRAADLNPEKIQKVMTEQGVNKDEAETIVIREKVQGKQPVKLRQDTQAEVFNDGNVLSAVIEDERQFEEMKKRGSKEQKKAMREGLHSKKAKEVLKKKLAVLAEEAERGIKKSAEEEKKLLNRIIEIEESPDFA